MKNKKFINSEVFACTDVRDMLIRTLISNVVMYLDKNYDDTHISVRSSSLEYNRENETLRCIDKTYNEQSLILQLFACVLTIEELLSIQENTESCEELKNIINEFSKKLNQHYDVHIADRDEYEDD